MFRYIVLLFCCLPAIGQKMHVKVLKKTVNGETYTRYVPGITTGNSSANVNCGGYAGCSGTANGSSVSMPAHTQEVKLNHTEMLLLLPDGRQVGVYCNDHTVGLTRFHNCGKPEVDEFEADFSGAKVKLTWSVGIDGKKKESETYIVGPVFPAKPAEGSK